MLEPFQPRAAAFHLDFYGGLEEGTQGLAFRPIGGCVSDVAHCSVSGLLH